MNPSCHPKEYDNHAVHEPRGYFFTIGILFSSLLCDSRNLWQMDSLIFICNLRESLGNKGIIAASSSTKINR